MANIDLKFKDFYGYEDDFIKVTFDDKDHNIKIEGYDSDNGDFNIFLDKSTAIKFAKTLRTEINKIKF